MIQRVVRAIPGALFLLSALTGLAVWLTCGSFDLLFINKNVIRAAMLPPWWTLPAAIVAAFLVLFAIVGVTAIAGARRIAAAHEPARRIASLDPRRVIDVILPCALLGLLALPYLPWLPDALPVLWLLAGPARYLVWIVVAWLVARGVWLLAGRMPGWISGREREWRGALAIFVITLIACESAAFAYKRTALFPGGDEPHYLILAQSLWRDHDLQIENNHKRGDYREYFERDLKPHYLVRGVDHQIYSIHPIGVALLIAPIYAIGGYDLVVLVFGAIASAASALLWLVARRVTDDEAAATAAWAACCLNGPWVFNSFAVYPEVPAALAAIGAFALVQRPLASSSSSSSPRAWLRWLGAGLAISTLPWLSTKYAPMSAMLALVALGRIWLPAIPERRAALMASLGVLVPYAISLAGWFTFFYVIWGTPWPSAPYGTQHETGLRFLLAGGPGLLFDQEYGILAFAPALIVSLVGLVAMLRAGGAARRLAVEVAMIFVALLVTVGAFHIWWGGSATTGRPIISGLLFLGVPFAWRYHQQRDRPAIIAAYHVLIAIGVAFGLTLAFAQYGLLLAASRNGVSRLLEWLSSSWSIWSLAPAFIVQSPGVALFVTCLWLGAALLAGWWLRSRPRGWTPGRAMLSASLTCAAAIVLVSVLFPPLLARSIAAGPAPVPPSARSRLLDEFDAARRPIALVYSPLRRVDPQTLPPLVEFVARADEQRPKQPAPLLYNARFALPAGRYAVELVSSSPQSGALTGTLALQLGRVGSPSRTWAVDVTIPGVWGRAFDLPIDVGFVGFRGSPEIERAKPAIRIRPVSIADAHERLPEREVLATRALGGGDAMLFFHNDVVLPEHDGFWTPGHSTMVVTVAAPRGRPARLRLRAGPVRTDVRLSAESWRQDVTLEPNSVREVTVPVPASGAMRLAIETSSGFVPARFNPADHDERLLGCWVELDPQDSIH